MGQGNSGAGIAPAPTMAGGTGNLSNNQFGMGNAFNQYQNTNDQTMGLDTLSSQYADQKSNNSFDWQNTLKQSLTGLAQSKIDELNPMTSTPMATQQGGFQQQQGQTMGGGSMQDLYNKLIQQQFLNWQNSQVARYKQGVMYGR